MKTDIKPIAASVAGVVILYGLLGQTAQGQALVDESGTAILADAFGTASGAEALIVSWTVVETQPATYTYSYVLENPLGDVLLNNNGTPTLTPESVDAYSVAFNSLAPGAYIAGSQVGGTSVQNNGEAGLFWSFSATGPNASSPTLSFKSSLPPTFGNANAQDDNAPSPWSSYPDGEQVPVPNTVPEPTPPSLFALTALVLWPLRSSIRKFIVTREDSRG
jgi:hypothetical protein